MTQQNRDRNPSCNIIIIITCVLVSILLPLFIQYPLNVAIRDLYNPSGWIVLQPHLRVFSTLICFSITYGIGFYCLTSAKPKKWLFILHAILTFIWCGFVAMLFYIGI